MDDLIKRGDAIGNINRRRYYFGRAALDEAFKAVYKAPSVDAVEVVRCKDCKYYTSLVCGEGVGWCDRLEVARMEMRYCSDGERKEDSK